MLFTDKIRQIFREAKRRVAGHIVEPLKLMVVKTYVESKGFHLGEHGTLLWRTPVYLHRGPLVVCTGVPNGRKKMLVMALQPGEHFDCNFLDDDAMPKCPFTYEPYRIMPFKKPLNMPLTKALENAVRAMDALNTYKSPAERPAASAQPN
jgi:hypothetical protein